MKWKTNKRWEINAKREELNRQSEQQHQNDNRMIGANNNTCTHTHTHPQTLRAYFIRYRFLLLWLTVSRMFFFIGCTCVVLWFTFTFYNQIHWYIDSFVLAVVRLVNASMEFPAILNRFHTKMPHTKRNFLFIHSFITLTTSMLMPIDGWLNRFVLYLFDFALLILLRSRNNTAFFHQFVRSSSATCWTQRTKHFRNGANFGFHNEQRI